MERLFDFGGLSGQVPWRWVWADADPRLQACDGSAGIRTIQEKTAPQNAKAGDSCGDHGTDRPTTASFQGFGFECPLPKHLKRTVNSGFPQYNLMVDAHFMAEMCAGILVAVTDYDRFDGKLMLDVAKAGEISKGMGQRDFVTKEGEIVLRDEKDIVCVLCQGADEKTRVEEGTPNVFFYAYAVPGIDSVHLKDGLTVAAETMAELRRGKDRGDRGLLNTKSFHHRGTEVTENFSVCPATQRDKQKCSRPKTCADLSFQMYNSMWTF